MPEQRTCAGCGNTCDLETNFEKNGKYFRHYCHACRAAQKRALNCREFTNCGAVLEVLDIAHRWLVCATGVSRYDTRGQLMVFGVLYNYFQSKMGMEIDAAVGKALLRLAKGV